MFRTKQIVMVAILGLALATATVYATTQSALGINGPGTVQGFQSNVVGGSVNDQNSQVKQNQGNGVTGGAVQVGGNAMVNFHIVGGQLDRVISGSVVR